ncbi:hypothetical protein C8N43_1261 [Litoreibacter ponti]|uniref:Uncharacterized protein n=1 Tax=Litoreibacter ponti TaxID=1510457 RepID=A0A2T6BKL6_9RHOB|nr:hypothetical protein [Litoreibacter ponti]PTX56601.1 hypothetical protein C8N43_1261 [Litoreibacter ponti]
MAEKKSRYDIPAEGLASIDTAPDPELAAAERGKLKLHRDGAQHRRYHSLFEDLQN